MDSRNEKTIYELFRASIILKAIGSVGEIIAGIYIFVRGLVQLLLVYALFRNKLWAYPALIFVLFVIVCTQLYAIFLSHSIATSIITLLDIVTIYLVAREYSVVRQVLG
jgi:uncharacterized membrane protein